VNAAILTLVKAGKAPYFCNISNENFPWFLSICIINLKAGSEVTERPAEDSMDISANELQHETSISQQSMLLFPRLKINK